MNKSLKLLLCLSLLILFITGCSDPDPNFIYSKSINIYYVGSPAINQQGIEVVPVIFEKPIYITERKRGMTHENIYNILTVEIYPPAVIDSSYYGTFFFYKSVQLKYNIIREKRPILLRCTQFTVK